MSLELSSLYLLKFTIINCVLICNDRFCNEEKLVNKGFATRKFGPESKNNETSYFFYLKLFKLYGTAFSSSSKRGWVKEDPHEDSMYMLCLPLGCGIPRLRAPVR